ncbi:hypothetical protein RhiirA1_401046 [Rhizophagus irregularis]|uniref:Uncharacterized protein n=1 Tax=Rhizophagus irregularis TaxID=588596 RepID=A0A2N0R3M9_9GLOM|nr:hypothetical protein RhiirA1_401046 [Rhizophagus irregularis]
MFLHGVIAQLSSFVENGFLKTLFDKSPQAMDKAQLLVETFGEWPGKDDKQVKNQSITANPGVQTSAKKPRKGKNLSIPKATQILTGYKEADDQREQVKDIIVYDILYTWDVEKILGELTLWGHTIKLSVKWQYKYQTLRVKIVLNSFTLSQFNKFWTTDLGGIPTCGVSTFKIIQTSRYFENWETTLKALDTPQVFLNDKELKWCQHSIPTLKKKHKPKAKNTLNKKSSGTGQSSNSNQPKKKDKKFSTKATKNDNQLMNPNSQKKAKNFSKKYSAILAAEFFFLYFISLYTPSAIEKAYPG